MRTVKRIGLLIFLAALSFFITTLFLGQYQLSDGVVDNIFADNKLHSSLITKSKVNNKRYASRISFLADLKMAISDANSKIIGKYGIMEADIEKIVELSASGGEVVYRQDWIDRVFDISLSDQQVQNQTLKDYTNWMYERKFDSKAELQKQLLETVNNVNSGIIANQGIKSDKDQLFTLTKASAVGWVSDNMVLIFWLTIVLGTIGALMYILPNIELLGPAGIKNNHIFFDALNNRGAIGIVLGTLMIAFYVVLYFYPAYIAEWTLIVDSLSQWMSGGAASQWFLYGTLYTLAILVMGIRFMIKYRHNKYQLIRTFSVMFFQTCFAFILVNLLAKNGLPGMDLKNMWPLDYSFFFDYRLDEMLSNGTIGYFMLGWGIILFLVGVPLFTYFFGKRWYCSWVCGCGGLAETAGDPFRQLSDKSLKAWKVERYIIHGVLLFAIVMTAMVLYTYTTGESTVLGFNSYSVRGAYGFWIGAGFSGIVGTGFYPLMGNRVWCRFGCPLAAYLGLVQRFKSRFRITTNGDQCISCGNCSTYCEMGIDVRWYAQRGQDIVRSSCVGCGVCSAVCPRGVLKLENGPIETRNIVHIDRDDVDFISSLKSS